MLKVELIKNYSQLAVEYSLAWCEMNNMPVLNAEKNKVLNITIHKDLNIVNNIYAEISSRNSKNN